MSLRWGRGLPQRITTPPCLELVRPGLNRSNPRSERWILWWNCESNAVKSFLFVWNEAHMNRQREQTYLITSKWLLLTQSVHCRVAILVLPKLQEEPKSRLRLRHSLGDTCLVMVSCETLVSPTAFFSPSSWAAVVMFSCVFWYEYKWWRCVFLIRHHTDNLCELSKYHSALNMQKYRSLALMRIYTIEIFYSIQCYPNV